MKQLLLILVAASFTFAQWGDWNGGGNNGGGKSLSAYKRMSVSNRTIYVYAPSNLSAKRPLLISCHGMDQKPDYQQEHTHWEVVADTADFVVVYPEGGTSFSTWDVQGTQDTKWMEEIINQMVKDYDIDTKRVYMSGFSMGGMFTYNTMVQIADKIAAFAPESGTNVYGAKKPARPVPIFHIHGVNDDVLKYPEFEPFFKNYIEWNNCPSTPKEQTNYPNAENSGGTMYTWGPCDNGVYVKHLKLPGRGHSPSPADVSDIWNFVKEYDVNGPISGGSTPESSSSVESSASGPASSSSVAKSSGSIARSSGSFGRSSSSVVARSSSGGAHWGLSSSTEALPVDPSLLKVSVFTSSDNYIVVAGAEGKSITVFNSLGHVVRTTRGLAGDQKVYTGAKGVYIVKVGNRTFKTSL